MSGARDSLHSARRPRLLDLFCGAGGASRGYHDAGFEVVGVDIKRQPNYPYEFHRGDALSVLRGEKCYPPPDIDPDGYGAWMAAEERVDLRRFDAIHASPPCQAYTSLRSLHKTREYADLIDPTRELLLSTGLPYVIENVELARKRLIDPIYVCGSMFDPPMDIKRHRYFEANWPLEPPMWPCRHKLWDFRYRSLDKRKKRGSRVVQVHGGGQSGGLLVTASRVVGVHGHVNYEGEGEIRKRAMGIDWMTQDELSDAIPPAYTEFVGRQLIQHALEAVA